MTDVATAGPIVTGVLAEKTDDQITLTLPGTDYRVLLMTKGPIGGEVGKRISGKVSARAKRIDVTRSGGRFIEPIYGRPRRIQGRVIAVDPAANTVTVLCGCAIACTPTDPRQKAADFQIGQFVGFDVEKGAAFEPV